MRCISRALPMIRNRSHDACEESIAITQKKIAKSFANTRKGNRENGIAGDTEIRDFWGTPRLRKSY